MALIYNGAEGMAYEYGAGSLFRRWFDPGTGLTYRVDAPFYLSDDFLGKAMNLTDSHWDTIDASPAGTPVITFDHAANARNGILSIALDNTNEVQDAGIMTSLKESTQANFIVQPLSAASWRPFGFEVVVKPSVLPTGVTTSIFVGLTSSFTASVATPVLWHDAALINLGFLFTHTGSAAVLKGVAKKTTAGAAAATSVFGSVPLATEWYILRMEAYDPYNANFYVGRTLLGTLDISTMTADTGLNLAVVCSRAVQATTPLVTALVDRAQLWSAREHQFYHNTV